MAITVPGDWDHLTKGELVGHVPAAVEPVNTLAQRTHYVYRNHAPPIFTGIVWNAAATGHEAYFPISPSADGLSYIVDVFMSYTGADTYVLRVYSTPDSATASATWTLLATDSDAITGASHHQYSATITIPAATKFLRIASASSTNHQLTGVTVYPALTNSPSATNPSGFLAFDDGFLGTGAPVHTEYLNRTLNNAAAVYKDRKWGVFSFLQTTALSVRLAPTDGIGTRALGKARISMPDDLLTRTATVKVRANDSASPDGFVEVYQVNGNTTGSTLTADNTDRSTTITLKGSTPVIAARVVSSGTVDVYYVTVEIAPTLEMQGTGKEMITAAAPPARTEYLTTVDGFQERIYWQRYPTPGLVFDPTDYTAGHLRFNLICGPGTKRLRPCVTRYDVTPGADVVLASASFKNADSGTGTHETIHVAFNGKGEVEKHPLNGSTDEQKQNEGKTEWGSLTDIATPASLTYPHGVDRLAEITEDDAPQAETIYEIANAYGFGGVFIMSDDITAL